VNGSELLQQARAAVKAARDFEPAGEHYSAAEVASLNRLCRDAYLACQAAGVTIGQIRVVLFREEREEHRAKLERICAEFKAAALSQAERRVA
jgi:hypothetical protein